LRGNFGWYCSNAWAKQWPGRKHPSKKSALQLKPAVT